ncbi:hypothetical protein NP233_g7918 [Leucocoprinus birnbaumii]|uniref:F-box domain-containing protein n=1 Tax=Leucocoprinus birnbaumii TaxID=56174 RepID=A0AAD5YSB7_9AGAR|nr:hypothetical protein NP233_g7918 [Leucocoprinus birnbaumii]
MLELPLDIWYRIIIYDLESEKNVLLSLALVSHSISELALDILWREQISLRPFYSVINSYSLSHYPPRRILAEEGGVKDNWGQWFSEPGLVLLEPLSDQVESRVRSYLYRIRKLKIKPGCPWVSTMLTLLESCVKFSDPVFPNLKDLHLSFSTAEEMTSNDIYSLLPLLPPSLQKVDLHLRKIQPPVIVELLNLVKTLACGVEQLHFTGPEDPEVFSALGSFTTLRDLAVSHNECATRTVSIMTATEFVTPLTALHSLALDLGAFRLREGESPTPSINFLVLKNLRLDGTAQDIQDFLHRVRSSSVRRVTFAFNDHEAHYVPYTACFTNVISAFPDAREIRLEFRGSQSAVQLTYRHLLPLKKLPLQQFSLFQVADKVPHRLNEDEISSLVRAWPRLTHFSLLSWSFAYRADILIAFSELQYLEHLEIYLNLRSIVVSPGHVDWSGMRASTITSPLEQLNLDEARCLPTHTMEIYTLLRHLLELFPRLRSISSGEDASFLQKQLDELICMWTQSPGSY